MLTVVIDIRQEIKGGGQLPSIFTMQHSEVLQVIIRIPQL